MVSPAEKGTVRSSAPISTFLCNARSQMHFDSRQPLVVARFVGEMGDIEMAFEFAIDAREDIEVERGGDPDGIVVCADQFGPRFDEIGAEKKAIARLHVLADAPQEHGGLGAVEIADGAAEKKQQRALAVLSAGHRHIDPVEVGRFDRFDADALHPAQNFDATVESRT